MQPTPRKARGAGLQTTRRGISTAFPAGSSPLGSIRGTPQAFARNLVYRGSAGQPKRPHGVRIAQLAGQEDDSNGLLKELVEQSVPLSPMATAQGTWAPINASSHAARDTENSAIEAFGPPSHNAASGIGSFLRSEGQSTGDRADRFTSDLQQLFNTLKAKREKLRLEYIRQGKIADPDAKQQLEDAIDLVGECQEMCPEFERVDREMSGTVDPLEKDQFGRISADRAVKRFKRSSAGDGQPLPCDVRPPPILLMTLDYLVRNIVGNHSMVSCHRFVGDRLRAVANDFIVQNYRGAEAIRCTEVISRYYIFALHDLGDMTEDQGVSHKQDLKMLMDNLKTLTEMYQDFHAMEPDEELDNEAEFMGYYLLAHPSTHSDVSFLERAISHNILLSREVQLAIELRELLQRPQVRAVRGYRTEGGHRCMANFFRRLRTDPYATALVAMVSELQFADVRRDGMQSLDRAYNPSYPFATDDLADWMGLDDVSQAADWAKECGLEVVSIGENGKSLGVRFGRKGADGRTLFAVPDDARARRLSRKSKRLIDEKLELTTVVDMLMGDRKRDLARKTSTLRQSAKPVATARAAPPVQQPLATMSTSASNQFSVPSTKRKNLVTGSDEGSLDLASRTVKTVPDAPRPPLLAIIPEPAVAVAPPKPSLPAFMFGKAVDPQGQGPTDVVRAAVGFPEDRRNHILPEPIPATTRSRQIPKNNSVPSAAPIVPSSISDVNDVPAQAPSLADPRLVSNIAADIMMEVLVQETVHSCSRILSESTVIQSQVMRASVIAVVCDKLLTSIVRDISKELLRDWRRVYKLQLWGFRRWREHCRLRKEVRKAEEQRRDKALQDRTAFLRAIQNLAVTADRRPSLKQRPVNYWGVSPPATAESSEASDRFRNVGLAFSDGLVRNFLPALKHSGGFEMDVFCKIVISTPCLSSPLNQEEWDLVRWTRACFGLGDDVASGNLEYLLDSGDVCVETLLRTMEHPDSNRETFYHVSIQRVESTATVQELDLVRREEGYITGPSAALFLLPSKNPGTSTQSYLETLRERLELFLLLLPPESRIPLTFASCSSWPNTDVWDNELAVSMDEIMQQYPSSVASFNFAHFGCNGVTNAGCAATFSIALADLVGKSPPAPDLVASSFLELWDSHFMDAYELVMRRMRRISCEHSVILAALELATGLFNAVLQTIAGLISSEDMRTLSFPAAEFVDDVRLGALPPVGWNSTAVLGPKRERIANFNLPSVKSILRNVSPERPAQSLLFAYAMSVRESFIEPELGENTGNIFAAEVVGLLGRGDTSDVPFADFMSCIVRYCCLALDSALEEIAVDKFAACVCLRGALEKEKMRYRTRVIEDAATWGDTHLPTSWQSKLLKPTIHSRVGTVPLGRKRAGSFGDGPNAVVKRPRAESSVASYADLFERIAKASSEIEQSLKIV